MIAKPRMERTHHALITEGVTADEQTLGAGKPFWVFFATNLGIMPWLMGVLVAGMGLGFSTAMIVLLAGSALGSVLPGAVALVGPQTRLSQIEASRYSLGRTGKKIPAFLNWLGAIGWDSINNILSATALISLVALAGITMPFWLAVGILVLIQMLVGIYGHHLIQDTSRYSGILLAGSFILVGIIAVCKAGAIPAIAGGEEWKNIYLAMILLVAFNLGCAPYAADYTRYLPENTPASKVFMPVFTGLFLSLFILGVFGYLSASAVADQTPDGVMKGLENVTGKFSPLVLFLVFYNSIPCNAVNDNSAAYCLMSAGARVSRPIAAALGGVLGYAICVFSSGGFIDFFENFLFFFAHWIAPWAAITLVHWVMIGKRQQTAAPGISAGGFIFVAVSCLSIFLFSANSLYTGILSNAVGGADIGPYIGFVTAAGIYYKVLKFRKNRAC